MCEYKKEVVTPESSTQTRPQKRQNEKEWTQQNKNKFPSVQNALASLEAAHFDFSAARKTESFDQYVWESE